MPPDPGQPTRHLARRLAIVGYGKMGRLIEQFAPEYGFQVALKLDEFNNADFEGVTAANFRGIDVAVDFSIAAAVAENVDRIAALGVNIVVGTTGWQDDLERVKAAVERHGIGLVWSPNYSIGARGRALLRRMGLGSPPLDEKGCALGYTTEVGRRDGKGRICAHHQRDFQSRRRAPRHARDRFRFRGRHHHFAPHRAQPGRLRPGSIEGRAMAGGSKGLPRIR